METQRDVQTFKRNGSTARSTFSAGSAMAMEIKRKKIRQSVLFLQTENNNLQEKLDFEVRMREGAYKLLLACSKREQVLNASKNLLTCNTRIKAYFTRLQKKKEEHDMMRAGRGFSEPLSDDRLPCRGTIALSGLRLPLMWKDSDHFNNRGSSRRVAVFCLMQIGSEVFDTDMVVVDRSVTDICFEGVTLFKEAVPQFELKVELWSCALEEELTMANTPKKLAKKLRNSFGKGAGKRLCPLLDSPDPDTFLQYNPIPTGAKYSLLAHTTLRLPEAEGSFQSHSLIVLQDAEWSSWLPLYGNLCCCLVAQPSCVTQTMMTGYLNQKQSVAGLSRSCSLYCVLTAAYLSCYFTPEEIDAKVEPMLNIPINKDTRIRVVEKDSAGQKSRSLSIINPTPEGCETNVFTTDTREELDDWMDALHQHLFDQSQWLHCCDRLMKIEVASPRKPSLFLTKQADSVYNDLSITSPGKFEGLTDIIHNKIEETDGRYLIGHEEKEAPNWSTLFDGSHSAVVQKSMLSQSKTSTPCSSPTPHSSSTPVSNKKRRAPPPPPVREPYAPSPVRESYTPPPAREPYAPPTYREPYAPPPVIEPYALRPVIEPYAPCPVIEPYAPRPVIEPYALRPVRDPYAPPPVRESYTPPPFREPYAPPPVRESYAPPTRPIRPPPPAYLQLPGPLPYHEKENSGTYASRPTAKSKTGRPSLDAKFSAIIQQLQRNNGGGAGAVSRKNAPLGVLDIQPPQPGPQQLEHHSHRGQSPDTSEEHGLVRASHGPAPAAKSKLRKSFRERMNLKAL